MPNSALAHLPISGLSEAEAAARLQTEGYNELPRPDARTPLRIVFEVLREPMLALLLGGGVIYLLLGDIKEALILIVFAMLSVVITTVQETRTERVLEALRDLTSPRALVVRGGVQTRIAGREVARGDILILAEGDRVPADARLIQCHGLLTDESLLTGESVPVRKIAGEGHEAGSAQPGGDDLPYVFSGSLVVRGSAVAEATATGIRSEIGRIGQSLSTLETEQPRLQVETRRLVGMFATVGMGISALAVVLYGLLRDSWLDAILAGIALGMSMLPEEFPVVLTVFMAMGAWRISRARVLTRRAAAIETLGSATVLCTDKTGTLTENRMSVAELQAADGETCRVREAAGAELPSTFRELAQTGALASTPNSSDPMDRAFHVLAGGGEPGRLVHEYGIRPDLLAVTNAWERPGEAAGCVVAAKGAPEAIAELCRLGAAERAALTEAVNGMAARGLRVLGLAQARHDGTEWPESQRAFDFAFLGLAGLADPIRESVPAAMRECLTAGIRVVMITGDYPATARAIAAQAGLSVGEVLTGAEVEAIDDAELARRARTTNVFARIMPQQKLRIVSALKADGEVVAMTGDGVNDAPSLKAAHIGIAMGGRGTDVAREASSIVLLDDDFGSIVAAVRLGRRIYDNLRKAMGFIFAVHVPIAGLALLPLLFGAPLLFGPIHIAFFEMVIDPVCSLVFEAEAAENDVMRRPPRHPEQPLFSSALIGWGVVQGLCALLIVGGMYVIALSRGMPADEVRALAFFALVLSIVSLIFVNRSFTSSLAAAIFRPNRSLVAVLLAVAAILAAMLRWSVTGALFRFGPLHADDMAMTVGAGLIVLVFLEAIKPVWRARLMS